MQGLGNGNQARTDTSIVEVDIAQATLERIPTRLYPIHYDSGQLSWWFGW